MYDDLFTAEVDRFQQFEPWSLSLDLLYTTVHHQSSGGVFDVKIKSLGFRPTNINSIAAS